MIEHDRDRLYLDVVTVMSDFTFCVLIRTGKTGDRTTGYHDRGKLCLDVVAVMNDDRLTEHHAKTSLFVS